MRNIRLAAVGGLITGFYAAFSTAASKYVSARAEGQEDAVKSSAYTGLTYLIAVLLLLLPYLFWRDDDYIAVFSASMTTAIGLIAILNGYLLVALDRPFRRNFVTMSCLSLGVAALSFAVGLLLKR
jgi:VIT1/CCC1 family predicted Fe2+/Mn2+ transporter